MEHFLVFCEGYHDQALVQKLLKVQFKFAGAHKEKDLDSFWKPLIPKYPPADGDLYTRTAPPSICVSGTASVAICVVEGDRIVQKIEQTCQILKETDGNPFQQLKGCVLVGDAEERTAAQKFAAYAASLGAHLTNLPACPGQISASAPRQGIYLFPDNASPGTLEIVLLACADVVYPDLKSGKGCAQGYTGAEGYIAGVPDYRWERLKNKEQAKKKAMVGCITNILKPGKTNQTSIADDDWVSQATLAVPEIASLVTFFQKLLQ